jgi:hypothetical protein
LFFYGRRRVYWSIGSFIGHRRSGSLDEINHAGAVADSLAFTITQMAKIDEAYKKAFPDRG